MQRNLQDTAFMAQGRSHPAETDCSAEYAASRASFPAMLRAARVLRPHMPNNSDSSDTTGEATEKWPPGRHERTAPDPEPPIDPQARSSLARVRNHDGVGRSTTFCYQTPNPFPGSADLLGQPFERCLVRRRNHTQYDIRACWEPR